jgi:hypothetical protein
MSIEFNLWNVRFQFGCENGSTKLMQYARIDIVINNVESFDGETAKLRLSGYK